MHAKQIMSFVSPSLSSISPPLSPRASARLISPSSRAKLWWVSDTRYSYGLIVYYTILVLVNFRTYARKTNHVFSLSFHMLHLSSPFPSCTGPTDLSLSTTWCYTRVPWYGGYVSLACSTTALVWSRDKEHIGRKPLWSLATQNFKLFRFSKFSLTS